MQIFPSAIAPFVNKAGKILQPFISYLQQFTIPPSNILAVIVGTSPFSYQAKEPGNVFVTGGVVSAIHLIRGAIDLNVTGQKIIPVGILDIVIVTYSGLPTIRFIPSYGQNTNG